MEEEEEEIIEQQQPQTQQGEESNNYYSSGEYDDDDDVAVDDNSESIEYKQLLKNLIKDDVKNNPVKAVSTQRKYKPLSETERKRRSENCKRMREKRAQKLKEQKLALLKEEKAKKITRKEYDKVKINKADNQLHQTKKQTITDISDQPMQKYVPLYVSGNLKPQLEPVLPLYTLI